jgi:hypothetical protein
MASKHKQDKQKQQYQVTYDNKMRRINREIAKQAKNGKTYKYTQPKVGSK